MPILENSVANISYVRYINISSLIIIDEVSMCPLQVLKLIDILLRDLRHENDKHKPFGGKKYFCAVIFGKYCQLSHMNHMELYLKIMLA